MAYIRYKDAEDVRELAPPSVVADGDGLLVKEAPSGGLEGGGPVGEGAEDMMGRGRNGFGGGTGRENLNVSKSSYLV